MYHAPRGTTDILPQEQAYWRYVEAKAARICQLYGFERIEFPVFEDAGLFFRSVGESSDIVEKEMYVFEDKGKNRLALVPEGTASVCRAYVEHGMQNLPQPVKLFYFTPAFRYERPQSGRYREHHQFGCEAIGEADPALDAEVIDMAWQFFTSLGLKRLNLVINSIGCKQCRPVYVNALKEYYGGHIDELCPDCRTRLTRNPLRLLDCKDPSCVRLAEAAPRSIDYLCPDCQAHFEQLKQYLGILGFPFRIDHRLVRGLDYYTRTVFEIQPEIEGSQSTIGGGGRYDNLIEEIGGKPTAGIGFATGMERIIANLKRENIPVPPLPKPQIFIAFLGAQAKDEVTKLTASLRKSSIEVVQALGTKSLKAQLRQANSLGASLTLIMGDEEVKAGTVVLRDMTRAEQETVPLAQVRDVLRSRLA